MGKDEASKPLVAIKQNAPNPSDILKTSLVRAERCRVVKKSYSHRIKDFLVLGYPKTPNGLGAKYLHGF